MSLRPGVHHIRAPLRITLAGGGTDLPSYYRESGGLVVSAAIDRHVHMLAATSFREGLTLKHLEWEQGERPSEIDHPILRAALERHWDGSGLELASIADVPPGSGLGSSGAYTVCALRALEVARGEDPCSAGELAELASEIELDVLGRNVGKQDQYVAAHGGIAAYSFASDDTVEVEPLSLAPATVEALDRTLLLFFTGELRSASAMLSSEVGRSLSGEGSIAANLDRGREIAAETRTLLMAGDVEGWSELLNEQWRLKRRRSPAAVTDRTAQLHEVALGNGAAGAALMGAGGGGFLLVHAHEPDAVTSALAEVGAEHLPFSFEPAGSLPIAR